MGIAIDWTNSNVIPYIEELCGRYINWEIATSTVWIVFAIIAIIIFAITKKKCDWEGFETIAFAIAIFVGALVIGEQTFDIVKCVFLPELQIYEYIQTLMN